MDVLARGRYRSAPTAGVDGSEVPLLVDAFGRPLTRLYANGAEVATANPLPVALVGGASTGDGAITDGVSAAIRATVLSYVNSKPVAVRLTDTNGDYVAPGGGGAGGTQYAEDTPAVTGELLMMAGVVRRDVAASGVDLDGDRTELAVDASGRLHVNGSGVTQPVSGPLTDAQLRAVAVPVSGTFFQATQPVSGSFFQATQPVSAASLPLPAGAATEATLAARIPVNGQALMAASVPVTFASNQSALPVTGTFWQATQPVSGPLTDAQLRATAVPVSGTVATTGTYWQATQPVSGTFWQATQPVSGTFFQATQPVSAASLPLPTGASTETTLAALNTKVTACNTGAVTISAALPAGANSIGAVTGPTLTKGTQGATGFSVQDLKDAGRTRVSIVFQGVGAIADALLSLVKSSNGTAAAGATSIAVASGKTLRITSATFSLKANAAAAAFCTFTLRINPASAALISSQSELRVDLGHTQALAGGSDAVTVAFPDGFELSGTQQLAVSAVAQATTNILSVTLSGFEY